MAVVEIHQSNKYVKISLPNGKVVDILNPVMDEICKWVQDDDKKPESGGYIIGYQHKKTGNISLEAVSAPSFLDTKLRAFFRLRDDSHNAFLMKAKRRKSYYMGVWHTHPQEDPSPSSIDWNDWTETLKIDKSACQYVFFIIAGFDKWRIWIGDLLTGEIVEGHECKKDMEGIYVTDEEGDGFCEK